METQLFTHEIESDETDWFNNEPEQPKEQCKIVAAFAGMEPRGGGRVIRSPRILFEEMSDYMGELD